MDNTRSSAFRRRDFLASMTGAALAAPFTFASGTSRATAAPHAGRLKQGVCLGVFKGLKVAFDTKCRIAAEAGAVGIDLVGPKAFPTLKKYGLIPTMVPGGSGIKKGINDPAHHAAIESRMRQAIKDAAAAGAPNVIVLAGDRAGLSDEAGLENSVRFLKRIKGQAEDMGVTLCLELLNSKVNHPGYMADHTAWGVALCQRVDSPRVKLLYDIYHMQIMEGDVIRTIRDNIQYIGHFHTAGNPGRHQFDQTQELCYPGICQAIADLNFSGFLSHEYTPTRDPVATLKEMMRLCQV